MKRRNIEQQRVPWMISPCGKYEYRIPSLKLRACIWKWMIGRLSFPFGAISAYFQGRLLLVSGRWTQQGRNSQVFSWELFRFRPFSYRDLCLAGLQVGKMDNESFDLWFDKRIYMLKMEGLYLHVTHKSEDKCRYIYLGTTLACRIQKNSTSMIPFLVGEIPINPQKKHLPLWLAHLGPKIYQSHGASWKNNQWLVFTHQKARTFLVVYKWHFSCLPWGIKNAADFCHLLWEAQNNHWTKNPVFFFEESSDCNSISSFLRWCARLGHPDRAEGAFKKRCANNKRGPVLVDWQKKHRKEEAHFFLFGGGGA